LPGLGRNLRLVVWDLCGYSCAIGDRGVGMDSLWDLVVGAHEVSLRAHEVTAELAARLGRPEEAAGAARRAAGARARLERVVVLSRASGTQLHTRRPASGASARRRSVRVQKQSVS
jgi:hypothetical protein